MKYLMFLATIFFAIDVSAQVQLDWTTFLPEHPICGRADRADALPAAFVPRHPAAIVRVC